MTSDANSAKVGFKGEGGTLRPKRLDGVNRDPNYAICDNALAIPPLKQNSRRRFVLAAIEGAAMEFEGGGGTLRPKRLDGADRSPICAICDSALAIPPLKQNSRRRFALVTIDRKGAAKALGKRGHPTTEATGRRRPQPQKSLYNLIYLNSDFWYNNGLVV